MWLSIGLVIAVTLGGRAQAAEYPESAMNWLSTHHRAGQDSLSRDYYWSQTLQRLFNKKATTDSTCWTSVLANGKTCYEIIQGWFLWKELV
jgi:hypothetical protein